MGVARRRLQHVIDAALGCNTVIGLVMRKSRAHTLYFISCFTVYRILRLVLNDMQASTESQPVKILTAK